MDEPDDLCFLFDHLIPRAAGFGLFIDDVFFIQGIGKLDSLSFLNSQGVVVEIPTMIPFYETGEGFVGQEV